MSQHHHNNNSTTTTTTNNKHQTMIELPENSHIVQPKYLEKSTSKKDLVRRLRNLVHVLRISDDDDDNNNNDQPVVEADSPEWPGLNATAHALVHTYLHHSDKDVRLYSVLACVEIMTIYAPEVPWDEPQLLDIFWQMTRQLGNLSHTFDGPTFREYVHILDRLVNIKIGCILVDLANQQQQEQEQQQCEHDDDSDSDEDDSASPQSRRRRQSGTNRSSRSNKKHHNNNNPTTTSTTKETPLEVMVEFLSTLLHCVRREHPTDVARLVHEAVTVCLSEFHPTNGVPFPIPVLDLLLHSIGQGPTQWVIAAAAAAPPAEVAAAACALKKNKRNKGDSGATAAAAVSAAVQQVQVPNPTYQVATQVIRSILNRIAGPISSLLNGLLNGEPHCTDQSSIRCILATDSTDESAAVKKTNSNRTSMAAAAAATEMDNNDNEVYNIVFELHRVAPQILTTVLGTVATGLRSVVTKQRYEVTLLLGRLFASNVGLAQEYAVCFRDWLSRKRDVDPSIRVCMVKQCMAVLQAAAVAAAATAAPNHTKRATTTSGGNSSGSASAVDPEIAHATADMLKMLVTTDPSLDVRMEAIHLVCDWAYKAVVVVGVAGGPSPAVTASLLQAVATRVSAKHKQERRDAVTGLAHVYFRQYLQPHLKAVIDGGDDCDLQVIVKALHETCHLELATSGSGKAANKRRHRNHDDDDWLDVTEEQYRWIPAKVLECVCFTDETDAEMRSRVVQIVDELLLGPSKKLTPTAQAIGLTSLLDSMAEGGANSLLLTSGNRSNAFKFLQQLLGQRATLQKTVSRYIDARAEMRACEAGTEEAMEADARAMEVLELVAKMTAPVDGTKRAIEDILQDFHGARDKHIFRILATIADPAHTMQARARALEELPKRTKALGDAVSDWVKNLVKRCAMGDSLNSEVVSHCVLLAQECLREGDVPAGGAFLATVKTAIDIFPVVCNSRETFGTLTELLSECCAASGDMKKELRSSGIVTALSSILSAVAISQPRGVNNEDTTNKDDLRNQLTHLCTYDGTPEQARNAVYTLARLLNPGGESDFASNEELAPLLQTLTSTSRLKISTDKKESLKVVSILSAMSALTDCAPIVLTSSTRGEKVVKFALEGILLGRDHVGDESGSEDDSDGDELDSPIASSKKQRRSSSASKKKNATPEANASMLEDENLSIACRIICAATDFLVSHVRSTSLLHSVQKSSGGTAVARPQSSQIRLLFQVLTQIIKDQGLPPSSRDRKLCGSRQDRAALRQCAAVSLLRLCDARLGLEKDMLSHSMWHTLSSAFLDEERVVRLAAMDELSAFFKGAGIYGSEKSRLPPKAPSLRFVSFITLCSDGDREQDVANGSAANVGKFSSTIKSAALHCIVNLRKMSEATFTQCCAMGKDAEKRFETHVKMLIMPEYSVPLAFHLLSHRRETPSEGAIMDGDASEGDNEMMGDDDRSVVGNDEGQQRTLRKRLKLLFDPLVQSLGDGADNISFLLRLTEILGKHYTPVDVAFTFASESSPTKRRSIDSNGSSVERPLSKVSSRKTQLLDAKLKTICTAARDVLLSYVKKDVNLSIYPGVIQLPASLFKRSDIGTVRLSQQSFDSSVDTKKRPRLDEIKTPVGAKTSVKQRLSGPVSLRSVGAPPGSSSNQKEKPDSRVTFSPVVQYRGANKEIFGGLSPIAKSSASSFSTSSGRRNASQGSGGGHSADTLGTTPPADLRTATALEPSSDESSRVSSKVSQSLESNVGDDTDLFPPNDVEFDMHSTHSNTIPSIKSTTHTSVASAVSLSQNQNSEPSSARLSQSSGQSSNSSTSRLRKRRAPAALKDKVEPEAKKKQAKTKRSTLPTQIKVKKVKASNRKSASDDLDFDFYDDDENKAVSRNHSKSAKLPATSRGSKSKSAPVSAKVPNAKATTTTARSRASRR